VTPDALEDDEDEDGVAGAATADIGTRKNKDSNIHESMQTNVNFKCLTFFVIANIFYNYMTGSVIWQARKFVSPRYSGDL